MTDDASPLVAAVRALYEAHPYPHYPLLARPRWQDGYLAHSRFAAALAADGPGYAPAGAGAGPAGPGAPQTVLIGGGGEILPYVVRQWEAFGRRVVSIDLSARSLRRAWLRTAASARRVEFLRGDLDRYLAAAPAGSFAHADVYGVLHHLPDPGVTLRQLARVLAPGGTARLMVYNAEARGWIRELQRLYAALGLSPLVPADLAAARALLAAAAAAAPALAGRLAQLGPETLASDARFCDTFLHPREARLAIGAWTARIAAAGFTTLGLLDRYAELDDLPNPLWLPPTASALTPRALDRRFENNLELFLARPGPRGPTPPRPAAVTWRFRLKAPPRLWFAFDETRGLPLAMRLRLWHAHLAWVLARRGPPGGALLASLPMAAAQRLARVGALLPGQLSDPGLRAAVASPLATAMEAPPPGAAATLPPALAAAVEALLAERGRLTPRRRRACLARLARAQR